MSKKRRYRRPRQEDEIIKQNVMLEMFYKKQQNAIHAYNSVTTIEELSDVINKFDIITKETEKLMFETAERIGLINTTDKSDYYWFIKKINEKNAYKVLTLDTDYDKVYVQILENEDLPKCFIRNK